MWTKENNTYKVVNQFGELVAAKKVSLKCFGIFWETTCGQWVKKVAAKREKLELTGRMKKMETSRCNSFRIA